MGKHLTVAIAVIVGTIILTSTAAFAGTPHMDSWLEDREDAYKTARMFAECSARYEAAAAFLDMTTPEGEDISATLMQISGTARGARFAGYIALYMEAINNILKAEEEGREIKTKDKEFFSDMVNVWAEGEDESLNSDLEIEMALATDDETRTEALFDFMEKINVEVTQCVEKSNKLQGAMLEAMREYAAKMAMGGS